MEFSGVPLKSCFLLGPEDNSEKIFFQDGENRIMKSNPEKFFSAKLFFFYFQDAQLEKSNESEKVY